MSIIFLLFFSMSFSQNGELNFKHKEMPKIDFVIFSIIRHSAHKKNELFTGKIQHEKLKDFFNNYWSISSSGLCDYSLLDFYYKNEKVGSKYVEYRNNFNSFISDIKPVTKRTKKFKTFEEYKIFKNKKSKNDNIYRINITSKSNDKKQQYIMEWYEW